MTTLIPEESNSTISKNEEVFYSKAYCNSQSTCEIQVSIDITRYEQRKKNYLRAVYRPIRSGSTTPTLGSV